MNNRDKGYLHPFWEARRFEYGVGEHIRTVSVEHFIPLLGTEPPKIVELKMHRLSYYIRSFPDWESCLNDAELQSQWRLVAHSEEYLKTPPGDDLLDLRTAPPLTGYQIDWVLEELAYYSRRTSNGCQPSCFERIWESDTIVSDTLLQDLCTQITRCFLSDATARQACLRPIVPMILDHRNTLLDFVHPFSFPAISGRTLRFEEDNGERRLTRTALRREICAIPTDFYITAQDDKKEKVTRLGYISGVPPIPRYSSLLDLIASILGNTIPLFEYTLTSLHRSNIALMTPRIPLPKHPPIIQYQRVGSGDDPPDLPGQGIGEGTDDEEDEALWAGWRAAHAKWVGNRRVVLPDLPTGGVKEWIKARGEFKERVSLRARGVQVFVKLGRVELGPGDPSFEGGEWTCEGAPENHIVACASIVVDSHNVSEGYIDFRMAVTCPVLTVDDPDSAGVAYWGKKRGSPLNQHIGSVAMKPGRCITYPNLYQHRLSSFHLLDPSRPGHRTTLQFALVDPEIAVLSTTDVPPQPASWAMEALMDSIDQRLPNELVLKIMEFAIGEEYFVRDELNWELRRNITETNERDRWRLGFYLGEFS